MKRLFILCTLLALAVAGCSSEKAKKEHNEHDISFAQGMIPHHEQAIEMAELGVEHANTPEVAKLAKEIKAAQEEEIKIMEKLLHEWGAPVKAPEHGGEGPELLPEERIKEIERAHGTEFDKVFLRAMIEHHESAVETAEKAVHEVKNKEAKKLADEIVRAERSQIEQMNRHLVGL